MKSRYTFIVVALLIILVPSVYLATTFSPQLKAFSFNSLAAVLTGTSTSYAENTANSGGTQNISKGSILYYLLPSVCENSSGTAVPGDPYACPSGDSVRKLEVGEEIPYVRYASSPLATEIAQGASSLSSVWMTAYPLESGTQQLFMNIAQDRAGSVTLKSGATVTAGHGDLDENDLPDVLGWVPAAKTYYDVLTSAQDEDQVYGFYTSNCEPYDGWTLFPKTFAPFNSPNGMFSSENYLVNLGSTLSAPLSRRSDGLYSGSTQACNDTSNYDDSGLYYASVKNVQYESGKVINSLMTLHYNVGETDKGGLVGELMYFTPQYGKTRWESWDSKDVIENKCQPDANYNPNGSLSDDACVSRIIATDRGNCPSTSSLDARTKIFAIDGKSITAYRTGCSDRSFVSPVGTSGPITVPIQPRVLHVSRDIFGANQNWVLNPDFAEGSTNGWSSSQALSITRDATTDNASLLLACSKGCATTATRAITSVMTNPEQQQLSWLQNVDAGVTLESSSESQATLTVTFTNSSGTVIATHSVSGSLSPNIPKRIKFSMPFTYAQLESAQSFSVSVSASSKIGTLSVDDAYVFPQDTN